MSRKSPSVIFSFATITALLVSGTFVGCAKDAAQSPFSPPDRSPYKDAFSDTSESSVRQATFESNVADPKWHQSLTAAIAEAQQSDKLILADFTGSDWCHWCVKLKQDVFETSAFKSWASDNVVLLELDYPKGSQLPPEIHQQNQMLKSRYGISSYPTVLLLDVEGNVRAKMGYEKGKSASQWVQIAESKLQDGAMKTRAIATSPDAPTFR
ncbi:thioredoxin family protein [Mariniblastus fucicola]|uniref:Disulfide bond reductase DsbH n=1 Tax=Mariniblastus fucicola TaxID=980251 RepID=A0A5B9P8I8_9BACT|nr:thioredoxin family protein [Mariniblastus fucicola]QEG22598.1 Disulfide bond reductase DsbH precursor [Mariniblastus fucicola]